MNEPNIEKLGLAVLRPTAQQGHRRVNPSRSEPRRRSVGGEDGKEEMYSGTEACAFEATRMDLDSLCLGGHQNGPGQLVPLEMNHTKRNSEWAFHTGQTKENGSKGSLTTLAVSHGCIL